MEAGLKSARAASSSSNFSAEAYIEKSNANIDGKRSAQDKRASNAQPVIQESDPLADEIKAQGKTLGTD